ncbi:MAG: hypothetical protein JW969_09160 [Spirochaetales bacterium]|nr:hypothetical protein [Spirochaetales bacterium]
MEIILPKNDWILWIFIGVAVIAVSAVLLKKGKPVMKVSIIAAVVIVSGILLFFFYKDSHIMINESGITADTYGEFSIKWRDIQKAYLVPDISESEYAPGMRVHGVAIGDLAIGRYTLKNGKTAMVTIEQKGECAVIVTGKDIYLFGVKKMDEFIEGFKRYREFDDNGT